MRRFGRLPLLGRVHAADPAAGVGIAHHPHPVPHDPPGIERVQEDAIAAPGVAVDRRGIPAGSTRWGHTLGIQRAGDLARGLAGEIVGADPAHDRGLGLQDGELARAARDRGVAVGAAAGVAAVAHHAREAAAHLVLQVGQEQVADQAADADLDRVGAAVMHGLDADADADEIEALVDAGQVLLVAADPVERLDHHHVEAAGARILHQAQDAVAADQRGRGAGAVGVGGGDGQSLPGGMVAAERQLIVNRSVRLEVGREPRVERGAQSRAV